MEEAAEPPGDAGEDDATQPLDPRWVAYRRRVGAVASLVFAAVVFGAALLGPPRAGLPTAPFLALAALAAVAGAGLGHAWPALAYRHASYRLGARALEIRRGVLWRRVLDVPRSRIQHSDVSQGPIERLHGLGTLSIFTAGTTHARVRLHGLAHERALEIRGHLMRADEDDVI